MKEEAYQEFRELFVNLSTDDQVRIYRPIFNEDKDFRLEIFRSIINFEAKHGDPIKWLKKNPKDFAIYKPIILGGISGKPKLLSGLIKIWKWNHF
jgi:hypothetical protein